MPVSSSISSAFETCGLALTTMVVCIFFISITVRAKFMGIITWLSEEFPNKSSPSFFNTPITSSFWLNTLTFLPTGSKTLNKFSAISDPMMITFLPLADSMGVKYLPLEISMGIIRPKSCVIANTGTLSILLFW